MMTIERNDPRQETPQRNEPRPGSLMMREDEESLRSQWTDIQAAFVDEPHRAVEHADALVAEAMKRMTEVFTRERSMLEEQWSRQKNVSTEDLRMVLQRYRTFFDRVIGMRPQ